MKADAAVTVSGSRRVVDAPGGDGTPLGCSGQERETRRGKRAWNKLEGKAAILASLSACVAGSGPSSGGGVGEGRESIIYTFYNV